MQSEQRIGPRGGTAVSGMMVMPSGKTEYLNVQSHENLNPDERLQQNTTDNQSLLQSLGNQGLPENKIDLTPNQQLGLEIIDEDYKMDENIGQDYFSHHMLDIQRRHLESQLSNEDSRSRERNTSTQKKEPKVMDYNGVIMSPSSNRSGAGTSAQKIEVKS